MRLVNGFGLLALTCAVGACTTSAQNQLPPDAPRPIAAGESL